MDRAILLDLLTTVAAGGATPAEAAEQICEAIASPSVDGLVMDTARALRTGLPEAVYGEGKTAEQCAAAARILADRGQAVVVTRVDADKATAISAAVPGGRYHPIARLWTRAGPPDPHPVKGPVAVIAAGTSDLPWAEEAAATIEAAGQRVSRHYDIGVAGLHRLLARIPELRRAGAIVAVAGMEGALPTVVAGLVDVPVFAVPAPVGYGVSNGGTAALLTMLSSCAPNVAVVNIGNGFGAAYLAMLVCRTGAVGSAS